MTTLEKFRLSTVVWDSDKDPNGFLKWSGLMSSLVRSTQHGAVLEDFLDAKLSKRMQCSDWSHRPLHSAQLEYAICDSVVLLRLYDVIIGDINDMCGDAEGVGYDHTQLLQTYIP